MSCISSDTEPSSPITSDSDPSSATESIDEPTADASSVADPSSITTSDAEPASSIGLYMNNGRGVLLAVVQPGITVSTHDGLLINVIDGVDAAVTQLGIVHSVNANDGTTVPVPVTQFGTTVSVHVVLLLT